jgi:hypothetical protein
MTPAILTLTRTPDKPAAFHRLPLPAPGGDLFYLNDTPYPNTKRIVVLHSQCSNAAVSF